MTLFPVESLVEQRKSLRVESLGTGVLRVVFCRPEVRNAFDEAMITELTDCLDGLRKIDDPNELRVLVLAGEGKVFSAGADLKYMKRLGERGEQESLSDAKVLGRLFSAVASFPAPVVSVVQGAAIGGGLGLSVCSDVVVAEERAIFQTSEVRLGIVPGAIGPYIIRKIGLAHASSFMLMGQRLRARRALELGLVQQIAPEGELERTFSVTLKDFLFAGPEALRRTKRLLLEASPLPTEEVMDAAMREIAAARCSDEGKHGLSSFFDKGTPNWAARAAQLHEALKQERD